MVIQPRAAMVPAADLALDPARSAARAAVAAATSAVPPCGAVACLPAVMALALDPARSAARAGVAAATSAVPVDDLALAAAVLPTVVADRPSPVLPTAGIRAEAVFPAVVLAEFTLEACVLAPMGPKAAEVPV